MINGGNYNVTGTVTGLQIYNTASVTYPPKILGVLIEILNPAIVGIALITINGKDLAGNAWVHTLASVNLALIVGTTIRSDFVFRHNDISVDMTADAVFVGVLGSPSFNIAFGSA